MTIRTLADARSRQLVPDPARRAEVESILGYTPAEFWGAYYAPEPNEGLALEIDVRLCELMANDPDALARLCGFRGAQPEPMRAAA